MKIFSRINLLRLFLTVAGLGWGATVIGVFLPWNFAVEHLQTFGGSGPIPDDTMLNYWLRMAAGAFGMIGVLFLVCAWQPHKYANIIPLLAILNLGEGILLLFYGLVLNLDMFPFVVDVFIGVVPGIAVLSLKDSLNHNYK